MAQKFVCIFLLPQAVALACAPQDCLGIRLREPRLCATSSVRGLDLFRQQLDDALPFLVLLFNHVLREGRCVCQAL
jgi:hypothetical protein